MTELKFRRVDSASHFQEVFDKAKTLAKANPKATMCSVDNEDCKVTNPNPFQFIDENNNGEVDDHETEFSFAAFFHRDPFKSTPFEPEESLSETKKLKKKNPEAVVYLPITNLSISVSKAVNGVHHGLAEIVLYNPVVDFRSANLKDGGALFLDLPATYVSNPKIIDLDRNGKFDIAFELVNSQTGEKSLEIFLQEAPEPVPGLASEPEQPNEQVKKVAPPDAEDDLSLEPEVLPRIPDENFNSDMF